MPYRYLEEIATADVAFEAWGATREEMFTASADALMNVMVEDLSSILPAQEVEIEVEHEELDLLLFNFLQELIFHKDARRLLLRVPSAEISEAGSLFTVRATALGEELDQERHHMNVDVKAVTLHHFSVTQTEGEWRASVILDI